MCAARSKIVPSWIHTEHLNLLTCATSRIEQVAAVCADQLGWQSFCNTKLSCRQIRTAACPRTQGSTVCRTRLSTGPPCAHHVWTTKLETLSASPIGACFKNTYQTKKVCVFTTSPYLQHSRDWALTTSACLKTLTIQEGSCIHYKRQLEILARMCTSTDVHTK